MVQTAVDGSQSKGSNEEDGDWPLEPVLSFGWDSPPRVAEEWEEQLEVAAGQSARPVDVD